ncbi:MAG: 50S ribosomal protein L33 [Candidatus Marinimicrobia bacterium]|nr:50S ribosomal protein L33 [Candidatus Neomarinimicrobiota bacterium]OUW50650.1 MAG: 50S ribosomal protein L33 [bacterium TMED190]
MGSNSKRDLLTLECPDCNRRNYTMTKNKRLHPDRVSYKKYCPDPRCRKRTMHKETK